MSEFQTRVVGGGLLQGCGARHLTVGTGCFTTRTRIQYEVLPSWILRAASRSAIRSRLKENNDANYVAL